MTHNLFGSLLFASAMLMSSGCTNHLYQAEMTGRDAYGKERNFQLYWTVTDPLLGLPTASTATLVTECSPTTVSFSDQPEGIVFRGAPGKDSLPGPIKTIANDQVCARVTNFSKLSEPVPGPLYIDFYCQPFLASQIGPVDRNYPAARRDPYLFAVKEVNRHWSWHREVLPAPKGPECREKR